MGSIKGKIRVIIYESDSNYKVGVIRVKETSDKEMEDFVGRTVHFTGYFANLQIGDNYEMEGNLIYKDKYGYQYNVTDYKRVEVKGRDAVIEFLTSDLVKGCGEATATLIVDTLGEDCLKKIKEDPEVLLTVPKMTQKKAEKIIVYGNCNGLYELYTGKKVECSDIGILGVRAVDQLVIEFFLNDNPLYGTIFLYVAVTENSHKTFGNHPQSNNEVSA